MLKLCFLMLTTSTCLVIVSGCSVQPNNKVVVVGGETSLTCHADGESTVNSWRLGSNGNKGTTIYQSAVYRSDGTIRAPEYIASGYSVIKLNVSRITLQMKEINFSQGGLYLCECLYPPSTASTKVAVLAQEPEFIQDGDAVEGKSVNFICSISFNGTADASFEISIKDSSDSILKRESILPLLKNQSKYQLTYSATADPNANQTFICSVKLVGSSSSSNVLYSREKTATVQWSSRNAGDVHACPFSIGLVVMCAILALGFDSSDQVDKTSRSTYSTVRKAVIVTPNSENKKPFESADVQFNIL